MTADTDLKNRVQNFYDIGSPYFLELWGGHIHDCLYVTGKETRQEAQENVIRLLAEKAEIKPGAKILDIGCGIGGSSIYLAKNLDTQMTGITISPVQVAMASSLAEQAGVSANFFTMDAENIQLQQTFDYLWMIGVLTHLTQQKKFIKNSVKLLKPGGRFVFLDWMIGDHLNKKDYSKFINPIKRGMVTKYMYTLDDYLTWFTTSGYRIVYSEDITSGTLRTWDIMWSIAKKRASWQLATAKGVEFIHLIWAIKKMRDAMHKGKMRCCVAVFEKN